MFKAEAAYFGRDFEVPDRMTAVRRIKNKVAIHLIRSWLEDDSGYDEKVWPKAKKSIEEHKLSQRNKFND